MARLFLTPSVGSISSLVRGSFGRAVDLTFSEVADSLLVWDSSSEWNDLNLILARTDDVPDRGDSGRLNSPDFDSKVESLLS